MRNLSVVISHGTYSSCDHAVATPPRPITALSGSFMGTDRGSICRRALTAARLTGARMFHVLPPCKGVGSGGVGVQSQSERSRGCGVRQLIDQLINPCY
ncbi:hypothetical protein SKAU_G00385150 [Synaphobranchus kaupii]|uniref:Uncharacterized protein n=1 Tax=Synaphobranchus kaupii TaxID=118154 RepID=A0A9Q1EEG8_SYNKA|nr:hypothetical protein SKAU_G00385150 [Synaphobranchus kaupii]